MALKHKPASEEQAKQTDMESDVPEAGAPVEEGTAGASEADTAKVSAAFAEVRKQISAAVATLSETVASEQLDGAKQQQLDELKTLQTRWALNTPQIYQTQAGTEAVSTTALDSEGNEIPAEERVV